MVIDPTGKVQATAGYGVETIFADVDVSGLDKTREAIPVL